MLAKNIRRAFIDFFVKRGGHVEISSAPLIPENDPTVLFTTAGMHPLVPYLMGEKHPAGKRLVDVQKCLRTDDIEEVGDKTHCTFFEMLGNWSLGDYFKKEAIAWSYEFLTLPQAKGGLGLDPEHLHVSCFAGDNDAPRDTDAASYWEALGFTPFEKAQFGQKKVIYFYGKKENWWGPAGQTGPCGPDTEMFYDTGKKHDTKLAKECHPNCPCGKYVEIWNDVFMQYNKNTDGTYEPLKQHNVDTGMGLERITAILQKKASYYDTDLFSSVIEKIRDLSRKPSLQDTLHQWPIEKEHESVRAERIIADHIRAATFILGDERGVVPSNTDQGYVLRRLIRRAIRHGRTLGIEKQHFVSDIAEIFIRSYKEVYFELVRNQDRVITELDLEEDRFQKTLKKGLEEFYTMIERKKLAEISGHDAFYLYETYGFPLEVIAELAKERGITVDNKGFEAAYKKHQEMSRKGAKQKFAGGLADHSVECTRLHTATHLLHEALRRVLGPHVEQRGSNITQERLRFDFSHPEKMTPEQLKAVESLVNQAIQRNFRVSFEEIPVAEAKSRGAIGLFPDRYDEIVKVYKVEDFSLEICGGPHVKNTGELKNFRIIKEEACSAGIRRIKAVVENNK